MSAAIPIADQITALEEAIAGERKSLWLLNVMEAAAPERRVIQVRIRRLEAAVVSLRRLAAGAPPKGAAA